MSVSIIKRPILSEKSTAQAEAFNRVAFEVTLSSTKPEIKAAVERFFKVKVAKITTAVVPGKKYRTKKGENKTASWKKAVVTLKQGDKIEFFKGV
ncbi:MAG: 50S ribosomal protein L23 [Proteobacteria bacterium]|jgi:large subunit ribosomal protein L23|nr:MAG: 50S ribosomal protein L23 [Pseudomonadota bacterium]